ncbi:hypothetical protein [Neisseria sp.]|uniref:hypothetical protein n=1 Tax=Neisseria sp. TaxID=192066 RepID=UPI0026DD4EFE|nr:hypothetical protein [Neisseria sp.]MDO4907118.1 hypothetical protein [Neisseria sp.]
MAYLLDITHTLGSIHHISDLGLDRYSTLQLLAKGSSHYCKNNQDILHLALSAANKCLKKNQIDLMDIDVVLFGSNSINLLDFKRDIGHDLISNLGLYHSYIQFIGFQNCGDLTPILRTAQAMINSSLAENILVIIADDIEDAHLARVVGNNAYLHSDAATACLISKNEGPFQMLDSMIRHIKSEVPLDFNPMDLDSNLDELLSAARKFLDNLLFIDLHSSNTYIITHNMSTIFNARVAKILKIPHQQIYTQYKLGHCMASDGLINLSEIIVGKNLKKNDIIAVVVPSRRSIGVTVFRYCN